MARQGLLGHFAVLGRLKTNHSEQPGPKLLLQLAAAARGSDPPAQASIFDHAQGRHRLHAEPLSQVGAVHHGDAYKLESVVVAAPL